MSKRTDFVTYGRNSNRGTVRGRRAVEHSFRQYGAGRSGLADRNGKMIAGNTSREVVEELGLPIRVVETNGQEWVVVQRTDLDLDTDTEAIALSYADNISSALGFDLDPAVLAEDLGMGVDIAGLGYDGEIEALLAAVNAAEPGGGGDEFSAEPKEGPTRTQVGDLWLIGDKQQHRLLVGDCTDPANVERLMGGERAQGIFTSPPYDQQRTYEGNMCADWRTLVSGAVLLGVQHCEDDAQLFINLGLVHRAGRVVRYWDDFVNDIEDADWPLFGWYVWDKLNGMPGDWNGRLAPAHEWIFHFARENLRPRKTVRSKHAGRPVGRTQRNPDGSLKRFTGDGDPIQPFKILDSVVRVSPQKPDELVSDHPAPFPVALPGQFMQAYDIDVWYEPFCGSGTSIVAAHRTGRRCFGCEIEPRYADVILQRVEAERLPVALGARE